MTGGGRSRIALLAIAVALLVAGCSWSGEAPGLLGRSTTAPTAAPPPEPTTPAPTAEPGNPDLPVVGEAVWTSAEGRDVTVRIAVHAVRRIPGAAVLDWSITPLSAGDREAGLPVPPSVDLGLSRLGEGSANIVLMVDDTIYRPLIRRSGVAGCVCTRMGDLQSNLRVGRTTLAQIAYPALPAGIARVTVDIATVPLFSHVPVTPEGMVPLALNPTDLTRPEPRTPPLAVSRPFVYLPAKQRFVIVVDRVVTSSTFTSLAWRIRTLDPGQGLDTATEPPITDSSPPAVGYNLGAASGLQVQTEVDDGRPLTVRLLTTKGSPRGGLECLCSDLRLWTNSLRAADAEAMVVTNFGPLPRRATTVDVVIPGVATLDDLPTAAAPYAAYQSAGPVARRVRSWPADARQTGWLAEDWPTPVPTRRQVDDATATVDDLVR